ncbi:HECT domain containing protein [Schizosaccharomyces japonicus yFS275]|uniref:HECT-type E3 ubiquitin transferase n=1 Tax=Schizosaccharomyces japonicus (strain yFS275 / FY16936) TaxID=402676 RepID=B6K591_SCHJY|nr:HECT domain containing protein [Schizosaccharomyces japonicus yFS275]EEB08695.1 HECT domain containing protein [Schizosaccharomyces japonicus yFS275]
MLINISSRNRSFNAPQIVTDLVHRFEDSNSALENRIDLLQELHEFQNSGWCYPRGDLNTWIPVLNFFDEILREVIEEHRLLAAQTIPFSEKAKQIVVIILQFVSFLMDHCANRTLFNSSDRLTDLLLTTDDDVLYYTLQLVLRIGQHANGLKFGKKAYKLPIDRLRLLSLCFPDTCQYEDSESFPDLIADEDLAQFSSWGQISFTFYPEVQTCVDENSSKTEKKARRKKQRCVSRTSKLHLHHSIFESRSLEGYFQDICSSHRIPAERQYELLVTLRKMRAFRNHRDFLRMIRIGMLSLASIAYVINETEFQSLLSVHHSDLPAFVLSILSSNDSKIGTLQDDALRLLVAMSQHRPLLKNHILTALNIPMSHGCFYKILKNVLLSLDSDKPAVSNDFTITVFNYIDFLSSTQPGGVALCNPLIMKTLLSVYDNTRASALRITVRVTEILDHLIYAFTAALPCSLKRKEQAILSSASLLKLILRSGGLLEFRNLIETSLVATLKTIMDFASDFGAKNHALAISIMSAFIHNEPTAYSILYEAGLPNSFFASIKKNAAPSVSLFLSLPTAFEAICLNQTGFELFKCANPFSYLFSSFYSESHCKVLLDSDFAGVLGNCYEELICHHPKLKHLLFDEVLHCLQSISEKQKSDFDCLALPETLQKNDALIISVYDDGLRGSTQPVLLQYIDVFSRFLEGLLTDSSRCHDFIEMGFSSKFLDLYNFKLPAFFPNSSAVDAMSSTLRLIADADLQKAVEPLLSALVSLLDDLDYSKLRDYKSSRFESLLDGILDAENLVKMSEVQNLVKLQSMIATLQDFISAPLFSSNHTMDLCQLVFSAEEQYSLLKKLGNVRKTLLIEELNLCFTVPERWRDATCTRLKKRDIKDRMLSLYKELDSLSLRRFERFRSLRYVLSSVPSIINSIFLGLVHLCSRKVFAGTIKFKRTDTGLMLASFLREQLCFLPSDDSCESFTVLSYNSATLSLLQSLFVNEKYQEFLHFFCSCLHKWDSFKYIFNLLELSLSVLLNNSKETDSCLSHTAAGCLRLIVSVISRLYDLESKFGTSKDLTLNENLESVEVLSENENICDSLLTMYYPTMLELWKSSKSFCFSRPFHREMVLLFSAVTKNTNSELILNSVSSPGSWKSTLTFLPERTVQKKVKLKHWERETEFVHDLLDILKTEQAIPFELSKLSHIFFQTRGQKIWFVNYITNAYFTKQRLLQKLQLEHRNIFEFLVVFINDTRFPRASHSTIKKLLSHCIFMLNNESLYNQERQLWVPSCLMLLDSCLFKDQLATLKQATRNMHKSGILQTQDLKKVYVCCSKELKLNVSLLSTVSLLRIFARLTTIPELAYAFIHDCLGDALNSVKQHNSRLPKLQHLFMSVLRNIFETEDMVKHTMRVELYDYFTKKAHSSSVDSQTFTDSFAYFAVRNVCALNSVIGELCFLKEGGTDAETSLTLKRDYPNPRTVNPSLEIINDNINYFLSSLFMELTDSVTKSFALIEGMDKSQLSGLVDVDINELETELSHSQYILKIFVELLCNFSAARTWFCQIPHTWDKTSGTSNACKQNTLKYIIEEIICAYYPMVTLDKLTSLLKALSEAGIAVVIALCQCPSIAEEAVFECITINVIKDLCSSLQHQLLCPSTQAERYHRLRCISNTVHGLVSPSSFFTNSKLKTSSKACGYILQQLVSNDMISLLVSATTTIDLSYPDAHDCLKTICVPLKQLVFFALDHSSLFVSMSSNTELLDCDSDSSSVSYDDDMPNVYRNSVLGLTTATQHSNHSSQNVESAISDRDLDDDDSNSSVVYPAYAENMRGAESTESSEESEDGDAYTRTEVRAAANDDVNFTNNATGTSDGNSTINIFADNETIAGASSTPMVTENAVTEPMSEGNSDVSVHFTNTQRDEENDDSSSFSSSTNNEVLDGRDSLIWHSQRTSAGLSTRLRRPCLLHRSVASRFSPNENHSLNPITEDLGLWTNYENEKISGLDSWVTIDGKLVGTAAVQTFFDSSKISTEAISISEGEFERWLISALYPKNLGRFFKSQNTFYGQKGKESYTKFFTPLSTPQRWESSIEFLYGYDYLSAVKRDMFKGIKNFVSYKDDEISEKDQSQVKEVSMSATGSLNVSPCRYEQHNATSNNVLSVIGGSNNEHNVDAGFLEALPDELLDEVLNRDVSEQAIPERPLNHIEEGFLEALPDDIRAEITSYSNLRGNIHHGVEDNISEHGASSSTAAPEGRNTELVDGVSSPIIPTFSSSDIQLPQLKAYSNRVAKPERTWNNLHLFEITGVASLLKLLFTYDGTCQNLIFDIVLKICENKQNLFDVLELSLFIVVQLASVRPSAQNCYTVVSKLAEKSIRNAALKSGFNGVMQRKTSLNAISNDINAKNISSLLGKFIDLLVYLTEWNPTFGNCFFEKVNIKKFEQNGARRARDCHMFPFYIILSLLKSKRITSNRTLLEGLALLLSKVTKFLCNQSKVYDGMILQREREGIYDERKHTFSVKFSPKFTKHLACVFSLKYCNSIVFTNALRAMDNLCIYGKCFGSFLHELLRQSSMKVSAVEQMLKVILHSLGSLAIEQTMVSIFASVPSFCFEQTNLLQNLKALEFLCEKHSLALFVNECDLMFSVPLWESLLNLLDNVPDATRKLEIARFLLPLIESFMIVSNLTMLINRLKQEKTNIRIEHMFQQFTGKYRVLLNTLVRENETLMSGSFSILMKNSYMLDFDNKRRYFLQKLHNDPFYTRSLTVPVRREHVFTDSYRVLYAKDAKELLHARLSIKFEGEEGVDAGGITREWFQVVTHQMLNPNYALFSPSPTDPNTFHPNKTSAVNPEHLSYFRFVGRLLGKALFDERLLDCHFSNAVYKALLNKPISLNDIDSLDTNYSKSLHWMLENNITDVITETFSVETDTFGVHKVIDLVPNGQSINVTEENKRDYVHLLTEYHLKSSVQQQLEHLKAGFSEMIDESLICIFSEKELELLLSGLPDIDIDDWKNNTEYVNYTPASSNIQWFWRALRSLGKEDLAKLLQFVTGTSKVPLNGFAGLMGTTGLQKFSIHKDYSTVPGKLPQSHTCFNQLDLPEYGSYEELKSALLTAIHEGSEGFGFA